MTHCYHAYGLRIASQLALPELMPHGGQGPADVQIGLVERDVLPLPDASGDGWCYRSAADALLCVAEVGCFQVRDGGEILVAAEAQTPPEVARLFLLGAAMGVLLHQRGLLVLHASAVAIDGRALVFVGDSGAGKSTIAAALQARGYPVVADDVVALVVDRPGAPLVPPAFPQLKLWPDTVAALGHDTRQLPLVHPELTKRAYRSASTSSTEPLLLGAIYVLAPGDQPTVAALSPQDGFAALLRCSYAVGMLGPAASSPAHFQQCVHLAATTPIVQLTRTHDLAQADRLTRLVEQHSAQLAGDPRSAEE